MRNSPSIVPGLPVDVTVYAVLDDLGSFGRVWREADQNAADEATVIRNIIEGQYERPVQIVAFNTAEGWARDVTEDIARAVVDTAHGERLDITEGARDFYAWATGTDLPVGA